MMQDGKMAIDQTGKQNFQKSGYDHSRLEWKRNFLRFLLKYLGFPLLAKIDQVEGLDNIPGEGPALLMINHIAFIDPVVIVHLTPRNIVPLAKIEVYNEPVWGIFPRIWEVIPVRRAEVDRQAIQQVQRVLKAGEIVLIAPEGTRGPALQRGLEGVAYLASRNDVPVIPVAIEGTDGFPSPRFSARWKAPGARVKFGRPFKYLPEYRRADRETLRRMTDEAMYTLAGLLPPERRGVYADLSLSSNKTIEWC